MGESPHPRPASPYITFTQLSLMNIQSKNWDIQQSLDQFNSFKLTTTESQWSLESLDPFIDASANKVLVLVQIAILTVNQGNDLLPKAAEHHLSHLDGSTFSRKKAKMGFWNPSDSLSPPLLPPQQQPTRPPLLPIQL